MSRRIVTATLVCLLGFVTAAPAGAQSAGSEKACGTVSSGDWKAKAYVWGPDAPGCAQARTIAKRALRNAGRDYRKVRKAGSWKCWFYSDARGGAIDCMRPRGGGTVTLRRLDARSYD